jgi:hypothetical protein
MQLEKETAGILSERNASTFLCHSSKTMKEKESEKAGSLQLKKEFLKKKSNAERSFCESR